MAGAANRCVIPEHQFDIEHLCELLTADRYSNPSKYSVVIVSEGATFNGSEMIFAKEEKDQYGHKRLGGVGDLVSEKLKELSPRFNKGRRINAINQRLGYLVRCGNPDAMDSIVPMAFGNLAMDLVLRGVEGKLVSVRNGRYDSVPLNVVTSRKKVVNVEKYYNTDRLRPIFDKFDGKPLFIMTSES
jgi:6-phosphofructokinase 1